MKAVTDQEQVIVARIWYVTCFGELKKKTNKLLHNIRDSKI